MTIVNFHDILFEPSEGLMYSVIAARYADKWIFVRHHERSTWEIPGGHIEKNESPSVAAGRELIEETGAVEFNLDCVATYSVEKDGNIGYGRLFLAEVDKIGALPDNSEIAERIMTDQLPEDLTYPDIQPHLFKRVNEYLKTKF
ncbi:MAG: NUDIX domain-containing protein [Bacteroidia bacterium]|nr:NUDIX domain-containing protein [Bacteroidia bacterium]